MIEVVEGDITVLDVDAVVKRATSPCSTSTPS